MKQINKNLFIGILLSAIIILSGCNITNEFTDGVQTEFDKDQTQYTAKDCPLLLDMALDESLDVADRIDAIQNIRFFECEGAEKLIPLISEEGDLASSTIVTLSSLGVDEAYEDILKTFRETDDLAKFATASRGLHSLVYESVERDPEIYGYPPISYVERENPVISAEELMKIYVEGRKSGFEGHVDNRLVDMQEVILRTLDNPNSEYLVYAVKASNYVYLPKFHEEAIPKVKLLLNDADDLVIKEILLYLQQRQLSKEEAQEIINTVPRKEIYCDEWDYFEFLSRAIHVE